MNIRLYSSIRGGSSGPQQPGERWGRTIYRATTILALAIVVMAIITSMAQTEPVVPVFALFFAVAIWVAGRIFRYLVSEKY